MNVRALLRSLRLVTLLGALCLGALCPGALCPSAAAAQEGQEQEQVDPAEDRATEFRAMEGPDQEEVPGGALMVAAYAIVWLFVMLFVWRIGSLHSRLSRDVERLERSLGATGPGADEE